MDTVTIQGETRELGSRHANDRLRRRGMVPAVVYGHGEENEYVALSRHDTELALARMAHVVKLNIGGSEKQFLIKDVQYDHLQHSPIHVDLMRVGVRERVEVKVAIKLRGTPRGVQHGGNLVHVISDLDVNCPLLNIPPSIQVKVDHLGLNESLRVAELELPPDVRVLHEPDEIVAVVHPPRSGVDAELEAEAPAEGSSAEPEVISKGPKEEAENEGGE